MGKYLQIAFKTALLPQSNNKILKKSPFSQKIIYIVLMNKLPLFLALLALLASDVFAQKSISSREMRELKNNPKECQRYEIRESNFPEDKGVRYYRDGVRINGNDLFLASIACGGYFKIKGAEETEAKWKAKKEKERKEQLEKERKEQERRIKCLLDNGCSLEFIPGVPCFVEEAKKCIEKD